MPDAVAGSDWTDREVDLIVAHYFDMLARELRGAPSFSATPSATCGFTPPGSA